MELGRLRRLHDQHISASLNENRDDLNLECPLKQGGKAMIRILVEHKSTHAPHLWLQLMRSILAVWERNGFSAVIPVILHTGPEPFLFETPQPALRCLPDPLYHELPSLYVHAIDLTQYQEEQFWNSPYLDHVAKLALSILKLAQQKKLHSSHIRELLRREWPDCSDQRRYRYLTAAFFYIKEKSTLPSEEFLELSEYMLRVHGINPHSPFAQELREERQKGIEQGLALEKLQVIEGMLANGLDWEIIQRITHLDRAGYESLKSDTGN